MTDEEQKLKTLIQKDKEMVASEAFEQRIISYQEYQHFIEGNYDETPLMNAIYKMSLTVRKKSLEPIKNKLVAANGQSVHPRAKDYLTEEALELIEEQYEVLSDTNFDN